MNRNISTITVLTVLLVGLGMVTAAHGKDDDMAALKARFAQRYPAVLAAKSAGKIGETWRGYIEPVKAQYVRGKANAKLAKLIKDENGDRVLLYKIIAKRENTKPEVVAKRNAIRNFKKAKAGHYLKGKDGKWRRKSA